ncbi:uncharacterized protein LOC131143727 [Malania oleifera]|uniref:uncharacterized protein LOC131143727 n=1 Tax=Malania oleifera TaxID=397392 RepID=UPI0025ADD96E|nr:uncharacterized protein LOC131143727 [Malania oleifera]XP_057947985.1 uncharacterized protein LOC131143727 [Malania oleifera]
MGTKVQCKSYLPGYYSMRDLNEDCNSGSWPLYYGEKTLANGQYCNGFLPRTVADAYTGYNKDVVKQTMLKHEAIFKSQVSELHQLYGIQKDLMDEIRRKGQHKQRIQVDPSLSSSPMASQAPSEDYRKWHFPNFPLGNSVCARSSVSSAENIPSPLSFVKGKNVQNDQIPSQSGGCSKDSELMESRPSKVRRKMFDLQLPADEYIDTEEEQQLADEKAPELLSYPPGNCKIVSESGVKLFLAGNGKTDCQGNALRSTPCLGHVNNLADLNEPIQVEEASASASVDFRSHAACHAEVQNHEICAKPKSHFLGLPKESLPKSHYESNNGTLSNLQLESKVNSNEWFSCMLEAGYKKGNQKLISQGYPEEKLNLLSQPKVKSNKSHEPSTLLPADPSKGDLWREMAVFGLEISERRDHSNYNHAAPAVASHMHGSLAFISSSDLGKSLSESVLSREKPSGSLSSRLNTAATSSKSSQLSYHCHEILGDKWNLNNNSRSDPAYGGELPDQNGFYHGSSSGSKGQPLFFPSVGFDNMKYSNYNNIASEHHISHGSAKYFNGSNCMDLKSEKDMNLNVVLSSSSSNAAVPQQGLEVIDGKRKHENNLTALPWLRVNPTKNEATNSRRDLTTVELSFFQGASSQWSNKTEIGNNHNPNFAQNIAVASSACDVEAQRIEMGDCPNSRKILGVPIFEKPYISKNESSAVKSPSASILHNQEGGDIENNRGNGVLDINLACDPMFPDSSRQVAADILVLEKETNSKVSGFRNHIDLNLCISEDEASLTVSVPVCSVKSATGIDLEAPIVPEIDEDILPAEESSGKQQEIPVQSPEQKVGDPLDELVTIAAEAIVAISSSGQNNQVEDMGCNAHEASLPNPLYWFVEVVFSPRSDLESKFSTVLRGKDGENEEFSTDGMDYFESMTLKLTETNVEEYLSKPQIADSLKAEETGTTLLSNRTRKGQARRGRQRRDFQRDILPGLASLSRHEVTEDLQTLGGLMRATGHSWQSGPTRRNATRNGCGRGRRRAAVSPTPTVAVSTVCTPLPLVQQLTNIEVGLEDRSLTGWGKTTRRPRRQRCPPGNPPSLPLT